MGDKSQRLAIINRLQLNSESYEDVYEHIIDLLSLGSGMKTCAFSIVEDERQFFKARRGLLLRETPIEDSICAKVIHQTDNNHIFVVEDASQDMRFAESNLVKGDAHIRFYAGLPVRSLHQIPVGSLCLIDTKPRRLTQQMCTALFSARALLENLLDARSEAIRDHLTGLFNRKYFDLTIEREWRRSYREALPLTVCMLDIDYFKAYNDFYGHRAGDDVLRQVANVFQARLHRGSDMVARYGGEEFVFVLPSTSGAGAETVVAEMIEAVYKLNIPHEQSPFGRVTVSAGISIAERTADVLKGSLDFVDRADQALYQAKKQGKNRLCKAI